ncbi:MAG: 30S ribosomal protein S12 methylthiotransferase RimO [Desulfurivibrio sp.]|nr:30S ribosomal protein S12 methylthiotransferase RimO [Desulfurivibrio sp.]
MYKVHLTSLGCPKNLVDSEVMLGLLLERGLTAVAEPEEADLLLVNTCGFIQSAVEEGIDTILELLERKRESTVKVVVTGCMVKRYGAELVRELPEVDLFLGPDEVPAIGERLASLLASEQRAPQGAPAGSRFQGSSAVSGFLMDSSLPRKLATPSHRAYLKVTEGCNNRCSYCLIPALRGPLRSRSVPDLVAEARALEGAGVKELTLVAQDLTAYGSDQRGAPRLPELLTALLAETAIPWLRLLYLYPTRVETRLLQLVADNPRITPYFDIPLQHVAEPLLKAMNRPYGETQIRELVARIRQLVPQAAIRSTFIVGFPGESEEHHERLAAFLRDCRLEQVGIFTYFPEEGSPAAGLAEQCADELKEDRRGRLMALQAEISLEINRARVGTVEEVLVEGVSAETDLLLAGRTRYQAPEIDGCVYLTEGHCRAGDLVRVRIDEAHPYDLVGAIMTD